MCRWLASKLNTISLCRTLPPQHHDDLWICGQNLGFAIVTAGIQKSGVFHPMLPCPVDSAQSPWLGLLSRAEVSTSGLFHEDVAIDVVFGLLCSVCGTVTVSSTSGRDFQAEEATAQSVWTVDSGRSFQSCEGATGVSSSCLGVCQDEEEAVGPCERLLHVG